MENDDVTNDKELVTKLHLLEMAWQRSSDHQKGAHGETRLQFDSVVLSINWTLTNGLLVGLNNGCVNEFEICQGSK